MAFVSDGYSYLLHSLFISLFSERAHVVASPICFVVFPPFSVASVGSHLFVTYASRDWIMYLLRHIL